MKSSILIFSLPFFDVVAFTQIEDRVGLRLSAGLSTIFTENKQLDFQSIFSTCIMGFGEHGKKRLAARWEVGYEKKGGFERMSNLIFDLHYGSIGLMAVLKNVPENGRLQGGLYAGYLFTNKLENGSSSPGAPSLTITMQRWDWGPQLGYEYIFLKKETFAISADIRTRYGIPTLLENIPMNNFSFGMGVCFAFL